MASAVHLPDDLAVRLAVEADRRGLSVDELVAELVADRLHTEGDDPLEAFIGCGASGQHEPFDIHAARAKMAERKLAEGA
ncbi:MAG: ribbon-helix-helix domain-containing protein [Actinomycetota bacterium]|nr:ribbon-helix-helix domain-containing protein [Actinomycetota bacterium]MDA8075672.1 ribbon-helix-helix domain-containing protein [Actinomycetota bacterium]